MASAAGARSGQPYFVDTKKGEVNELKALLRNVNVERDARRKRDVIKKVIAYMTLGIDVSRLFSEMVLASNTKDLVVKKMVYLYLCNYANANAELTLLVINTLQKDCRDEDPMIRGLALRSLCSLRLKSILEYVMVPLKASLTDTSSYVRKTGVMGILKVYHLSPAVVKDSDLIDTMYNMIRDRDPVVVTNCIVALNEIMADEGGIAINQAIIHHLLGRIRDLNEWGQCIVLSLVPRYRPSSKEETFQIMNVLDLCLRVSNSAVVLAACKCFLDLTKDMPELQRQVYARLKTPLLTLMASASSEVSYCVLAHIALLVVRCRGVFDDEFKSFFCRYNDPSSVKHIKLDVLPQVANEENAGEIVAELSEYVADVDAAMARHAIRSIGALVVRLPAAAARVIECLLELAELDVDYVRAETVVVMQDMLRKYPDRAPDVIPSLHRALKRIDDPTGKASVIWMIGEYGHLIEEAPYMLEPLIDAVGEEESVQVRCELLTATVKLFFKRAPEVQRMLGRLFKATLEGSNSAAVHDRALLYFRLLRSDVTEAQAVIAGERPPVSEFLEDKPDDASGRVFAEFDTLSVVYGKPSEQFISEENLIVADDKAGPAEGAAAGAGAGAGGAAAGAGAGAGGGGGGAGGGGGGGAEPEEDDDLLGGGFKSTAHAPALPAATGGGGGGDDLLGMDDFFGGGGGGGASAAPAAAPALSLSPSAALEPPAFQGKWGSLGVADTAHVRATRVPTTDAVLAAMTGAGIRNVAHGDTGAALKFYLYAAPAASPAAFFLVELVMDKAGQAYTATVKAEAAAAPSASAFSGLLKGALAAAGLASA